MSDLKIYSPVHDSSDGKTPLRRDTPNSSRSGESPSPLKIAIMAAAKKWGGGEEQARLLANGLRSQGHQCLMIGSAGSEFLSRVSEEGFESFGYTGSRLTIWTYWQLRRKLVEFQPEVIHFNDPHSLTLGGLASRGISIPVRIVARHTSIPIRWVRRYNVLADRTICVCHDVARVARECGISPAKIRMVHPGVPGERFAEGDRAEGRRSLGLGDDTQLLLTIANLSKNKGHEFLLAAMPGVLARFPNVVLALAGDGKERASLEQQARRLGIESRVQFLGFRRDVPNLVRACDLFVMPTLFEGICSVLIEAMFGGAPIVTTNASGIPEVVGDHLLLDGPVAWVVPPGDPKALEMSVCEALDDPVARRSMAERGYTRASKYFSVENLTANTLGVYREVMEQRLARSA